MSSHRVEINLNGFIEGRFDLNSLRMGYRYSPWEERDGEYHQGLLHNKKVVKAILKSNKGRLLLRLESNSVLSPHEISGVGEKVAYCLGLGDDLSPLSLLAKRDANLKKVLLALPGYRLKSPPTLYETIIAAMLSQNCSAQAFFSMRERLVKTLGRREVIGGEMIYAFPLPKEIAQAPKDVLSEAGLYYRAKFIQEVASRLSAVFLEQLGLSSPEQGMAALKSFKGVGDYTARVVQIYGLRRYNFLFTDGYVQKLLGRLYLGTHKPHPREIYTFAQAQWGEWQAYVLDLLIAYEQSAQLKQGG